MPFKRARTNEQINERKKEIIIAAATLFDKGGIDEVQFKAISEMTSFARSTIYNYYQNKEEILLDLLSEEITDWVYDVKEFTEKNQELNCESYCDLLAETFVVNYRVSKLLSLLYLTLEKNVSVEKLTEFKSRLFMAVAPFQESITKFFPESKQQSRESFMFNCFVFVSGLGPFCELTEKQIQAMKNIGQEALQFGFKESCYNGFLALTSTLK